MAEAVQLPSMPTRYFCYRCDREVSLTPSAQLTCPDCSSGFLEEVSDGLDLHYLTSDSGEDSEVEESELNFLNLLSLENLFRRTLLNIGSRLDSVDDRTNSTRSNAQSESSDRETASQPVIEVLSSRNFYRDIPIDDDDDWPRRTAGLQLGDYMFGDDIDALSTMLLNDTEITGPPPLPKNQIKLLPVVTVSKEDVDKKIQCTVCMDDFIIREKVKCLPCSHLYHEKCIEPWLERHSTCPNCRKRVEIKQRKRSHSCPRSDYRRSANQRRSSESGSLAGFFRSPFRFI